jgi:hypothetical protein
MFTITDDLIQSMMYTTLTIGIYGMIESKNKPKMKRPLMTEQDDQPTNFVVDTKGSEL